MNTPMLDAGIYQRQLVSFPSTSILIRLSTTVVYFPPNSPPSQLFDSAAFFSTVLSNWLTAELNSLPASSNFLSVPCLKLSSLTLARSASAFASSAWGNQHPSQWHLGSFRGIRRQTMEGRAYHALCPRAHGFVTLLACLLRLLATTMRFARHLCPR